MARKDGMVAISVYLSKELAEEIKEIAKREKRSQAKQVELFLERGFAESVSRDIMSPVNDQAAELRKQMRGVEA